MNSHQKPFPSDLRAQLEVTCKELNQRIARLALALDLSLDQDADMARVMQHVPPDSGNGYSNGQDRRTEHNWNELRGLIVLRDELEKRCVDAIGLVATSDILVDIEQKMVQRGFKPGADGMDLGRLLGASGAAES
jgi:hypothetical protein